MDIQLTDPDCRVRLIENPRARRFVLRLSSDGSGAVLTYPPGVPRRECESFLIRHAGWLRRALAKAPATVPVCVGARIPVDGVLRLIEHDPARRSAPRLEGETLTVYGRGAIAPKVSTWLKARASDKLVPAAHRHAENLGRRVSRVALRDMRSRWGSCASDGALSFSWRLAMAPPGVQEYLAVHEAAHLVEMNHSPRYWAVVADLMPDWEDHRHWLRREGRNLHAYIFKRPDS